VKAGLQSGIIARIESIAASRHAQHWGRAGTTSEALRTEPGVETGHRWGHH